MNNINNKKYVCIYCKYGTDHKGCFGIHLNTIKHRIYSVENKDIQLTGQEMFTIWTENSMRRVNNRNKRIDKLIATIELITSD